MATTTTTSEIAITEDEAALYDRQIRLWGVEAQQRMRNATIVIIGLKGTATEVIKNIVLAGVGRVVLVDSEHVQEEDLGCGFFFAEGDVGTPRAQAAKGRIGELNPRVIIEVHEQASGDAQLRDAELDTLVKGSDLVCVTDVDRQTLIRVNGACRRFEKKLYAGGTYGMLGYVFVDLGTHEYIAPDKTAPPSKPRSIRLKATYPPLSEALKHSWKTLTKRQTKELNPSIFFAILALWEYQALHGGTSLPHSSTESEEELERIANTLIQSASVNTQTLPSIPRPLIQSICGTAHAEFSPICAVVGGILAQDLLKALAEKEAPMMNFFVFDGISGGGSVARLNMP